LIEAGRSGAVAPDNLLLLQASVPVNYLHSCNRVARSGATAR
jgi:hypothetical protein